MSKSNVPHPFLALVVAVLLFGGVGYGAYHHLTKASEQRREVEQNLFVPYFQTIADGRSDEARERFTTPGYKDRFSSEQHRAHWQATASSKRFDRELLTVNTTYDATNRSEYLLVTYGLTLDHDYVQAVYHVVRDADGHPRIDWAGRLYSGTSQVTPEPW